MDVDKLGPIAKLDDVSNFRQSLSKQVENYGLEVYPKKTNLIQISERIYFTL